MYLSKLDYKTRYFVKKQYPSKIIVNVCGGWMIFDNKDDYKIWKNQK